VGVNGGSAAGRHFQRSAGQGEKGKSWGEGHRKRSGIRENQKSLHCVRQRPRRMVGLKREAEKTKEEVRGLVRINPLSTGKGVHRKRCRKHLRGGERNPHLTERGSMKIRRDLRNPFQSFMKLIGSPRMPVGVGPSPSSTGHKKKDCAKENAGSRR